MPLETVTWKDRRGETNEASVEQFLEAARCDPLFPIPYPIAASMLEEDERPDGISITQLLGGCLSCKVLQHFEPYSEDIMARWHRWRGSMFHGVLERHAPPGTISEVRFYANLPFGLGEIHGKPDLIDPLAGVLYDAKTTQRVPDWAPWSNHVEQLQLYRWLVNHASKWDADLVSDPTIIAFNRLIVWYIDAGRVKPMEVKTSRTVATKPGAKNPTKNVSEPLIWSNEECEALLTSRYDDLRTAMETYERTRRLPDYLPGFDYISDWTHTYSPTARTCVERHMEARYA